MIRGLSRRGDRAALAKTMVDTTKNPDEIETSYNKVKLDVVIEEESQSPSSQVKRDKAKNRLTTIDDDGSMSMAKKIKAAENRQKRLIESSKRVEAEEKALAKRKEMLLEKEKRLAKLEEELAKKKKRHGSPTKKQASPTKKQASPTKKQSSQTKKQASPTKKGKSMKLVFDKKKIDDNREQDKETLLRGIMALENASGQTGQFSM